MTDKPAVLGNAPVFSSKLNIVRPRLPAFEEMKDEMAEIFSSGMVTKGRHVTAFEQAIADHLGVKNAVAVSSCTLGLMLTYKGLGLTGDVVVPSFTFMATASSLVWAGLRPVFADVKFSTTNLDPAAAEAAITPQTTAIVAVHNFGNPAEIDELKAIADRRGLKLIFDAAHGFGAWYRSQPVGSQGDAQVYSLSPTKLLIAGEGGIVATNDNALADRIRMGREYGNDGKYDSAFAGLNARMPELSALMGRHSLRNLDQAARQRNHTADLYRQELGSLPGIAFQEIAHGNRSSYREYSIMIDSSSFGLNRDQLATALTAENVDTRKYYHPPVHRQTAYQEFAPRDGELVNTDLLASRSLSLPMWSEMSDETALNICRALRRISECADEITAALNQKAAAAASSQ
jgi:dTDP-4-amino-4,6-dideoxygalactose transaminase